MLKEYELIGSINIQRDDSKKSQGIATNSLAPRCRGGANFAWDTGDLSVHATGTLSRTGGRRASGVGRFAHDVLAEHGPILEAEIVLLRHQLNVLRRGGPAKPKLTVADRLLFVWLYRLFPLVLNAFGIVQPETVIRWHRAATAPTLPRQTSATIRSKPARATPPAVERPRSSSTVSMRDQPSAVRRSRIAYCKALLSRLWRT